MQMAVPDLLPVEDGLPAPCGRLSARILAGQAIEGCLHGKVLPHRGSVGLEAYILRKISIS